MSQATHNDITHAPHSTAMLSPTCGQEVSSNAWSIHLTARTAAAPMEQTMEGMMQIWIYDFTDGNAAVVHRFPDGSGGVCECDDSDDLSERLTHLKAAAADSGVVAMISRTSSFAGDFCQ